MPKTPAFLAILGVTLALTACSTPSPEPDASADAAKSITSECTPDGAGSKSVTVSGDFGAEPTVTFESPLSVTDTERSVVIEGTGTDVANAGAQVSVSYVAYNASTGKTIDTTGYGAEAPTADLAVDESLYIEGLVRAINCSVEGDRVVAVMPPADAFGATGEESFGVGADDSIIFVIDINSVVIVPSQAWGEPQEAEKGLPTVALAKDGAPTITIPKGDAPTELKVSVLKKGDGAVIAAGDTVSLEYTGVIWATGKTFDSSWKTAGATTFPTTGVIEGFSAAMVGQAVGSQVLVIIPPASGYGSEGKPAAGISGTDTLVFVLDLLGTAPAA